MVCLIGFSRAKEGNQYKFYKNIGAICSNSNNALTEDTGTAVSHVLRSPMANNVRYFCYMSATGLCTANKSYKASGISPCFAI